MRTSIIAFALGVGLLQRQAELPGWGGFALAAAALALGWRLRAAQGARVRALGFLVLALACGGAGYLYAGLRADWRLAERLDSYWEGRDIVVTGVVATLPQQLESGMRFGFDVEAAEPEAARPRGRISLAWYGGSADPAAVFSPVRAGERWRLPVRLRRPHGRLNPQGFDYESWLLQRGIGATGYVRAAGAQRLAQQVLRPSYLIESAREALRERHRHALAGYPYAGILLALAIGDQNAIDAAQWQLFARTGVSHLMSISGLHVTMVASLLAVCVAWVWRRLPRAPLALPVRKVAALAGFLAALGYCLIAGFGVPAQRTLYMVGVVAVALWADRASSASRVLCAALLLVLLIDPWAVLAPGFWLSFGAVAVIFYVATNRLGMPRRAQVAQTQRLALGVLQWGRVQWAITLALAPLLLVWFQQMSLVSPLANAIAIPVVSLGVTPLALAGSVLPFDFLLELAHALMALQMRLLEWCNDLPLAVWQQHAPGFPAVALALLGTAWMLLPRGAPARWMGITLLSPLFLGNAPAPKPGALWLTVLDVGQGLAVLVQTENHALLYDAGPAYRGAADSGSRVVLPLLRASGIARLDAMVISHDDNDHMGGAASILAGLPVDRVHSALPSDHTALAAALGYKLPCAAGQRWSWDGVFFEMLHPAAQDHGRGRWKNNDRSCVLRIAGTAGAVLLTGDIEAAAERALLERAPDKLRARVLVAPHHSSRSSSSREFLAAVAPEWVILPVGYRNRYAHPDPETLERYRRLGARLLRTDAAGAILVRTDAESMAVDGYRDLRPRYWHVR